MKKVVVVEDDLWLTRQYERLLGKEGYKVWSIPHALGAIDLIDAHMPDVVIVDMMLVGTTAMTLLHELQSHSDLAPIPIVLISNTAENIDLKDMRPYGVQRILDKATMQPDDIAAAVKAVT